MKDNENSKSLIKCKYCRQTIAKDASICHYCNGYQNFLHHFRIGYLSVILVFIMVIISYFQLQEVKKERIAVSELRKDTIKFVTETADLVALMASFTGWLDYPNYHDRNAFFNTILKNSKKIIKDAGDEPNDLSGIKRLDAVTKYVFEKGKEGLRTCPDPDKLKLSR